jgi:hypothetical protein
MYTSHGSLLGRAAIAAAKSVLRATHLSDRMEHCSGERPQTRAGNSGRHIGHSWYLIVRSRFGIGTHDGFFGDSQL